MKKIKIVPDAKSENEYSESFEDMDDIQIFPGGNQKIKLVPLDKQKSQEYIKKTSQESKKKE